MNMITIREALLSVRGENAASIEPILAALCELGFEANAEAGDAFHRLDASRATGLNLRQQLALAAAIEAAARSCATIAAPPPPPPAPSSTAAAHVLRPDTTNQYLCEALGPATLSLDDQPAAEDLRAFLKGPLGKKLPVPWPQCQYAAAESADVLKYIYGVVHNDNTPASNARCLHDVVSAALRGSITSSALRSEYGTAFKMCLVVDEPLSLAAQALDLDFKIARNAQDTSGATLSMLRPDFLCWIGNTLLFKGEEKVAGINLQEAIKELRNKMANTWVPDLLPGVSMPCMLAYAAAGNHLQFFALTKRDTGTVNVLPISSVLNQDTRLGRIQALHCTLNIFRLLVTFAHKAALPSVALGSVIQAKGARGELLRAITFFEDFVQKRVYSFTERHAGINDFSTLQALYSHKALAQCANLARLRSPADIRLGGTTLVLHLVPVGVPLHGPPRDVSTLKRAIRDVLTGVAALHSAGFVHRDIRWPNVLQVRGSKPDAAGSFVLIDLEHAGRSGCTQDCRQAPFPLATWPPGVLDPADGRYTPASDLCLVAHCLLSALPFKLTADGESLRLSLLHRQLSVEDALAHAWLATEYGSE